MTIGLSATQIRKLTPGNGYTDRQLLKQVKDRDVYPHKSDIVKSGDLWWSNGYVVLFEPAPQAPVDRSKILDYAKQIGEMLAKSRIRVYPVEIRESGICKSGRLVRFSDGNDLDIWVDAKLLLSALMTRRAGRKGVEFYAGDTYNPSILVKNGRNIALVLSHVPPKSEPEWNFRYTGEIN